MNTIQELSLTNHTTPAILDRLELSGPSLEQIEIMKSILSIASYRQEISPETIRQCVGDNTSPIIIFYPSEPTNGANQEY